MARSLRVALNTKAVQTTRSESLELIAKAFAYDNWNILAAKIDAAQPRADAQKSAEQGHLLYCSFCCRLGRVVNDPSRPSRGRYAADHLVRQNFRDSHFADMLAPSTVR
jgi:Glyoxalase superfamily protein